MLQESVTIDKIEIAANGIGIFREATAIIKEGVEISKIYHRTSLTPGQDLTGVPQNVQDICSVVWTPEVIEAYQASRNEMP